MRQSASKAGWGFSTSRQHTTIGETDEKPLAETVFLVVRSRKHRIDGGAAGYIQLAGGRAENHARRFSRTSVFGAGATGIADLGCSMAASGDPGGSSRASGGPGSPPDQETTGQQRPQCPAHDAPRPLPLWLEASPARPDEVGSGSIGAGHDLVFDRGSPEPRDGAAGVVPLARFARTQAAWGEEMGRRPLARQGHTEEELRGDPC